MTNSRNKKGDKKNKGYGIWAWVRAIYGPIIFWVLFVNLPKVEWKYVFESNKEKYIVRLKVFKNKNYALNEIKN